MLNWRGKGLQIQNIKFNAIKDAKEGSPGLLQCCVNFDGLLLSKSSSYHSPAFTPRHKDTPCFTEAPNWGVSLKSYLLYK